MLRWGFSGAAEFAMGRNNGKLAELAIELKKAAIEAALNGSVFAEGMLDKRTNTQYNDAEHG